MKRLILSLTVIGLTMAVQAGDTKTSKTKTASGDAKASTTAAAKTECAASAKETAACSSCCKPEVKKQALLSPKAAAEKGS